MNRAIEKGASAFFLFKKEKPISKKEIEKMRLEMDNLFPVEVKTLAGEVFKFTLREIRFLDAIRDGQTLGEAVRSTKLDWEKGYKLINQQRSKRYLGDRAYERMQAEGYTADRWVNDGLKVLSGEKKVDRQQTVVWQELGTRVMPKVREGSRERAPVININIGALEEAERRIGITSSEVIEAEVPNGTDDES